MDGAVLAPNTILNTIDTTLTSKTEEILMKIETKKLVDLETVKRVAYEVATDEEYCLNIIKIQARSEKFLKDISKERKMPLDEVRKMYNDPEWQSFEAMQDAGTVCFIEEHVESLVNDPEFIEWVMNERELSNQK